MEKTPFYDWHKAHASKMVTFAGYELPLSYSSIKEEHAAVRERSGLFDISHMACFRLEGDKALQILEMCTPRKIEKRAGKLQYNVILHEDGGIADDVTIFTKEEDKFIIIANAANRQKLSQIFTKEIKKNPAFLYEIKNYVLLALQGPQSEEVISSLWSVDDLYFYEGKEVNSCLLLRSGYTGEDGFEILAPQAEGMKLWQHFLAKGVQPCGLAARDLLRLEAFYPLYGQEISDHLTCASCRLGWLIDEDKVYYGKERILREKASPPFVTLGFFLEEDGIPRPGYTVYAGERPIGEVTSGSYSFLWERGFGLMRLKEVSFEESLFLEIRSQRKKISIVKKSPLKGSIKRRRF
ncbi:MAG: glycine cleavage system aminomethyltransferase GcvT [Leptospiraceae bacterium]|nr:glycine cleavage system aminomethyltransferase GcvT [Leptospiraceae bacterium]